MTPALANVGAPSLGNALLRGVAISLLPRVAAFTSMAEALISPHLNAEGLIFEERFTVDQSVSRSLHLDLYPEVRQSSKGPPVCLTGLFNSNRVSTTAFENTQTEPDNLLKGITHMRSVYPNTFWDHIQAMFPNLKSHNRRNIPVCVDVAIGSDGRGGVELASRGFHVYGIEADASLLARTFAFAQQKHTSIELMTAKVEKTQLSDKTADLVTFLHGLHLVDTPAALREAWRILKPNGTLIAAWNDRNLTSRFAAELESCIEKYVPAYNRRYKQRTLDIWTDRLQHDRLFKLVEYAVYQNPMKMESAAALIELLNSFSFISGSLSDEDRKSFEQEVTALVTRRYGHNQPFELPLESKVYVLHKIDDSMTNNNNNTGVYHHHHNPHGSYKMNSRHPTTG